MVRYYEWATCCNPAYSLRYFWQQKSVTSVLWCVYVCNQPGTIPPLALALVKLLKQVYKNHNKFEVCRALAVSPLNWHGVWLGEVTWYEADGGEWQWRCRRSWLLRSIQDHPFNPLMWSKSTYAAVCLVEKKKSKWLWLQDAVRHACLPSVVGILWGVRLAILLVNFVSLFDLHKLLD